MITVTAFDHDLGEGGTEVLRPDNYVLVLGEHLYLAGEVIHRDGTRVITVKRREDAPAIPTEETRPQDPEKPQNPQTTP